MMEKILSRSIRMICLGGMGLGMHAAYAQTTDAASQQPQQPVAVVQVTGSRLASPNAESPSPLQVLNAADIAASGATNLQELLQNNPTIGAPAISRTNSAFATSSAGVATVDLRNLGTSRTLVLVNGRRFVAGVPGTSAVDLNSIPTDFIERVELLTGGASATYGSDAVAGVVNIITKKNFNGLIVDAQGGESTKKDDLKRKLSLTFGTSNDNGFVMGHLGFSRQGQVWSRDRAASAVDQYTKMASTGDPADAFTPVRPSYSSYAPQGRFFYDGGSYTYDKSGNITPWSTNGSAATPASGFNRSYYRSIALPTDRYLMALNGELNLNENNRAFFEGSYANTRVSSTIEPFALSSSNIYADGQVPAELMYQGHLVRNPIVPQYLYNRLSDTNGDGLKDYSFSRRLSEVGTRSGTADRNTFRLATGLKGNFNLFGDWNYEAFGAVGQTSEAQQSTGQVNVLNFRNALEAVPGPDGTPICADANARAQGCVPINVFGYNSITQQALAYVNAPGSLTTRTTQKLAGASINGEPFQLPAGAVGIAAGFEWRNEYSESTPDALTQAGLNAGNATPPTSGQFNVKEAFVEARVPILKDMAFAKNLSFLGAARHGQYSTVGGTNSWNAGFEWQPLDDVKFRGTRALSTRAPNINELYTAPSQDFPADLTDPCAKPANATVVANCAAAPGVAANKAANGGTFVSTQNDMQGVSGYNSGNPNLKAEKGRSSTVGIVYTPHSIPMLSKFTFTADFFNIKIADAIVSTPRSYELASCYDGTNPAMCSLITRRPVATGGYNAGSLQYVNTMVTNSGGLATEGVDITAQWADKVGPGRLSTRLAYTYTKEGYIIPTPASSKDEFAGEIGAPKNKANLQTSYKWGDWNLNTTVTYVGRSSLDDQWLMQQGLAPHSIQTGSRTYTDFQLAYQLRKSTQLYFGMDNVFNTKPAPIISGLPGDDTSTETAAGTYDAIGRRFYAGLRVKL